MCSEPTGRCGSGVVVDPVNRSQLGVDVVVFAPTVPGEPRRIMLLARRIGANGSVAGRDRGVGRCRPMSKRGASLQIGDTAEAGDGHPPTVASRTTWATD